MANKLEFLAQLPIFEGLDETELAALVQISEEYTFDDGSVIAYQRDVADNLYIVRSGRLFARSVDNRGIVRDTRSYLAGDYFDDVWLFAPETHPATVKGAGPGRIIIIRGSDFLSFLEQNRQALDKLEPVVDENGEVVAGLSNRAWQEAIKLRGKRHSQTAAVGLLPDELVEYYSRRSRWFLLLSLLGPIFGLLIFPTLAYALLGGQPTNTIWFRISFLVPALLAFIFLAFIGFRLLDWSNDYFVITNKHLIHREFDLRTFRTTNIKIPIEQIQSVEVVKPNLVANLLRIGTARVTTAAQTGVILFDNIDDPMVVQETINRLGRRVKALDAGREQALMRQSIESHFQADEPVHKVEDPDEGETIIKPPEQQPGFWEALLKRYRWRVEEDGVITYRKHFFVLLRQIGWPLLAAALFLAVGFVLSRFFAFTIGQLLIVFLVLFSADLGWIIWQIEDWRNDTFQVTERAVIDIDRRPFGFGESRKQALLSNIQNVNAERPGLLPTLFDYGNVYIETAGATANITFENVTNPSQIQRDIFQRLDRVRQQQRAQEGAQRRKEYAVLLDVYKQAMEQGRIPRRTPPPSEFGEIDR